MAILNAEEYTIADRFNIYSAKRTVYLPETGSMTLTARTTCEGLSYQLLLDGVPVEDANAPTLTISGAQKGLYSVEITSAGGTRTDIFDLSMLKRLLLSPESSKNAKNS